MSLPIDCVPDETINDVCNICDVACWKGDSAYDDNFEFIIYSVRALSKLQNDTLFVAIDQCK